MTFSEALTLIKHHAPMARKGWNGKDLLVRVQKPDDNGQMNLPFLYLEYPNGDRVPWAPSQTDLLAEDWFVV